MRRLFQLSLLLPVLTACGDSSPSLPQAVSNRVRAEAPVSAEELSALNGVYIFRNVLASIDQLAIPGFGETQRTVGLSYGYSTISTGPNGPEVREQYCRLESSTSSPAKVTITDKASQLIPVVAVPLQVSKRDGVLSLYRPFTPMPLGAELADPNDPLPTSVEDPRVVDFDGDGHPGLTAKIKVLFLSGEVYVVRRENFDYTLSKNAAGHFTGITVDKGEQITIGASLSLLKKNVVSAQDPDLSRSTVVMIPASGPVDCESVNAQAVKLFAAYPLPKP